MQILFLNPTFPDTSFREKRFGVGVDIHWGLSSMSAVLLANGHKTSAIHFDWFPNEKEILSLVKTKNNTFKIDIIGIGFTYHQELYIYKWIKLLKSQFDIPIVVGGLFPSMRPNDVIEWDGVDYLCIGEGEKPLLELMNSLENKQSKINVKSIWYKIDNQIIKNPVHPIEGKLDDLPFYDYSLFNLEKTNVAKKRLKPILYLASRGCPFSCTFCANHAIRNLYPNPIKYLRFQSVDRVIRELKILLKKTPYSRTITFSDITFNANKKWIMEFCEKYSKKIGLPYRITIRLDLMTKEIADALRYSGCYRVSYGLESGNEWLRNTILKRPLSNENIIEQALNIHHAGIQSTSSNMVGLPHETIGMTLETIKLNAKCMVDTAIVSIFCPHPNTILYDYCEKKKYIDHNTNLENDTTDTMLRQETISPEEVRYSHRMFRLMVSIYKRIYKAPSQVQKRLECIVDRLYLQKLLPAHDLMVKIHDRYFQEFILSKQYRKLESPLIEQFNITKRKEF